MIAWRRRSLAWIVTCCAGALLIPAYGGGPAPRVELDQREIHLGTLVRGQKADAEFTLRNAGGAELRIEQAKPGCGCTVVSFDETIPPGGKGVIRAVMDSTTLSGDVGRGITVSTNDPERPTLFLVVRAQVLSSVEILPSPTVRLSNRIAGQRVGRAIVRRDPFETGEVRLTGLASSVPWLSVRSERLEARRPAAEELPIGYPGDWLVEVRLGDGLDYGAREATVSFETGLPRQPKGQIKITTDLRPPVSLSAERIDLEAARTGGTISETVLVSVRSTLR